MSDNCCPKCRGKRGDYVMAYWKWHGGPTWEDCWYCQGEGNIGAKAHLHSNQWPAVGSGKS